MMFMCQCFFNQPLVEGHLRYFQFWAIINVTALNSSVQVFVQT